METKEKVMEILKKAGKPMKSGEIAETGNIDKKEVDKAIKHLKTAALISSPKVCYYEISK